MLKIDSRSRSEVGRVSDPDGASSFRPLYCPATTRTPSYYPKSNLQIGVGRRVISMDDVESRLQQLADAVENSPGDLPRRFDYAVALYETDRVAEALDQCVQLLGRSPDHLDGLKLAETCATQLGEADRAASYRRAWQAHQPAPRENGKIVSLHPVDGDNDVEIEKPRLSLANVKGLARSKRIITSELASIRDAEDFTDGLLLYGPPNCGKTYLARVVAGELGASFVPLDVRQVVEHWSTWGGRRLRDGFRMAQRNLPCVVFLDEIDSLHPEDRSSADVYAKRQALSALQQQFDMVESGNGQIIILAAATLPWQVDASLIRPGRLGRVLLVLPPDPAARKGILESHIQTELADDVDMEWIIKHTDGFSGSDLDRLIEVATQLASERNEPPSMADLKSAMHSVRPSAAAWLSHAAQHAMIADGSGMYDDLQNYLRMRSR